MRLRTAHDTTASLGRKAVLPADMPFAAARAPRPLRALDPRVWRACRREEGRSDAIRDSSPRTLQ